MSETTEKLIEKAPGLTDNRALRDRNEAIELSIKINKANAKSQGIPLFIYTDNNNFHGYNRSGGKIDISGKNLFMVVDFAISICADEGERPLVTYLVNKLHSDNADVPKSLFIVESSTDSNTCYTFHRWVTESFDTNQMMNVLANGHIVFLDNAETINIRMIAEYKNEKSTPGIHEHDVKNPDRETTMYVINDGLKDIPFNTPLTATMRARMIKVDGLYQGEVYKVSYNGHEGWVKAKNVKTV